MACLVYYGMSVNFTVTVTDRNQDSNWQLQISRCSELEEAARR